MVEEQKAVLVESVLAEFEPDGAVLFVDMVSDVTGRTADLSKLLQQPLEERLLRYYTQTPMGNMKFVLHYGRVDNERGWKAKWEPSDVTYWSEAHTLHVTVDDKVYKALEQQGSYVMKPVWRID